MSVWKDRTSYSRGKERVPTTWTLEAGEFTVTITCGHIYHKGEWVAHCEPFFQTKQLFVSSKEEAQAKAVLLVIPRLRKALSVLEAEASAVSGDRTDADANSVVR